jgi:Family of unknown function (DUF6152)
MKTRRANSFALVVCLLAVCCPLWAHHGNAVYETSKTAVFKDVAVTKFVWANPHVFIQFDVKDDQGNLSHWVGESGSPASISLLGWSKSTLHPGDSITVYLYPAKNGSPVGRLNKIVLPDGTTLRDSALGYRDPQ